MKEIIFGIDCVLAALQSSRRKVFKMMVYDNKETQKRCLDNVIQLAQQLRIPIQYITRIELDKYTEGRPHQNVALQVSKFQPPVLAEVPKVPGLWLLLANLLDPQNLGSIIRSAAFFGASGVITGLRSTCDFTPIVSKASAGTLESFDSLYRTKSITAFLSNSKSASDAKVIGTGLKHLTFKLPNSVTELKQEIHSRPIILLLGNEGSGLSEQILQLCDANIVIDNGQSMDSLNVSVAAGILLDRLIGRQ